MAAIAYTNLAGTLRLVVSRDSQPTRIPAGLQLHLDPPRSRLLIHPPLLIANPPPKPCSLTLHSLSATLFHPSTPSSPPLPLWPLNCNHQSSQHPHVPPNLHAARHAPSIRTNTPRLLSQKPTLHGSHPHLPSTAGSHFAHRLQPEQGVPLLSLPLPLWAYTTSKQGPPPRALNPNGNYRCSSAPVLHNPTPCTRGETHAAAPPAPSNVPLYHCLTLSSQPSALPLVGSRSESWPPTSLAATPRSPGGTDPATVHPQTCGSRAPTS